MTVSPTQSQAQTVLRSFLLQVLPMKVEVVEGQDNRVPEPKSADFVVFWPIRRTRLETNTDTAQDVSFTASIAGTTLTVSAMNFGTISVASTLFGTGVSGNTIIQSQLSGTPGGIGTYQLSQSQTVSSEKMACGTMSILAPVELVMQLDVHGPNASDNSSTISALFRDDYAVEFFKSSGYDVTPFHADDPRYLPFVNDQQQVESRWIVEAHLQLNQVLSVPQQFADTVTVGIIEVEASYPP